MQSLIAQSTIAKAVLGSLTTAMIGLGTIQIGAMIFTALISGAEKLWHNYLSLNGAQKEYEEQLEKTQQEDYWDSHDIETTTLRIKEATSAAKGYRAEAEAANKGGWASVLSGGPMAMGAGLGMLYAAHKQAGMAVTQQQGVDKLAKAEQQHDLTLLAIKATHPDGLGRSLAENEENFSYTRALNTRLGNGAPDDAGAKKKAYEDQIAQQEAKGHRDAKSQTEELARLHEEALEAQLHGSALYHAQEAFAIEDLQRRGITAASAVNDVHAKFHAEELKRMQAEENQIRKMREETALGGLTGVARIQQEGRNKVSDIVNDANSNMDPGQRLAAIHEATLQTQQAIAKEQETFAEHVNSVVAQSADRAVTGFARIHAEADRAIAQLQQESKEKGGKPSDLQRGEAGIRRGEAGQVVDLNAKNQEETAQLESEARSKLLSAEKQQTQAIETEYEQRTRKYKEELQQQEISQDDYNRRVVAAGELRDAQMVEASKAAREKMAGEFTSLFRGLDHPIEALKGLGEKAAGEAAAAMVQRMQSHFGGGTGAASAPTGQGLMESLMSRIAGHPGAPGAAASHAHGGTSELASVKTISLGTAEIHIQSASVAFGGAGAAGSSSRTPGALGAAGAVPGIAGGSTELLTMPGSAFNAPSSAASSTSAPHGFGGGYNSSGGTTGGAGAVSAASAPSNFAAGSPGAAPAQRNVAGAVMGDIQQGTALTKQAINTFGGGKSGTGSDGGYAETQNASAPGQFDKNGNFQSSGSTNNGGGMLGGGGVGANAMGAANGAMGLYAAYQGNGGVGGAASGAMSGMQLGMALGGPIGAGIGAAAGAIVGAIGFGGREKARVYDLKQVRPRIGNDIDSYQQGGMDYLSAYADVQSLDQDAKKATNQLGPAAQNYYQDTIKKEIKSAEAKLTAEQKAGRSQYTATAAQYDWGGPVDNFGAFGDGPTHGMIRAQRGEYMVEQQAANTHAGALNAINSGATPSDMARYYGGGGSTMPAQSASSGDIHLHLNAIDGKSALQFLTANKHHVRAALNASLGENSGASDA
jgi:hypothetical protein